MHGEGKYDFSTGKTYEGGFFMNDKHGYGIFKIRKKKFHKGDHHIFYIKIFYTREIIFRICITAKVRRYSNVGIYTTVNFSKIICMEQAKKLMLTAKSMKENLLKLYFMAKGY